MDTHETLSRPSTFNKRPAWLTEIIRLRKDVRLLRRAMEELLIFADEADHDKQGVVYDTAPVIVAARRALLEARD